MACFVLSASSFKVSARETLITCGYEKKKKISIEYPLLFDGVGNRMDIAILFSAGPNEYVYVRRLLFYCLVN